MSSPESSRTPLPSPQPWPSAQKDQGPWCLQSCLAPRLASLLCAAKAAGGDSKASTASLCRELGVGAVRMVILRQAQPRCVEGWVWELYAWEKQRCKMKGQLSSEKGQGEQ